MGKEVKDEYDLGFLFIALSPEMFDNLDNFKENVDNLAQDIREATPNNNINKVQIPGEISRKKFKENYKTGKILIEKEILEKIRTMSTSLEGGIESNDKIN